MSLDVDCDVCRLRLQPPAVVATALLVAAVVVASVHFFKHCSFR
jgi:preprotein translocase subunit Sec61beta